MDRRIETEKKKRSMKKAFSASIHWHGLQGGALILREEEILFRCRKTSIEKKMQRLSLKYRDIQRLESSGRLRLLPDIEIYMKNGEYYKFTVFRRKKFLESTAVIRKGIDKDICSG